MVEEIDTVILAANASGNIMILHSPKNCGGTRTHPNNKVVCMLGQSPQAICILLDQKMAFADQSIVVPLVQDLAGNISAEEVAKNPSTRRKRPCGIRRIGHFHSPPVLQNTILLSNTKNPFELIPIISNKAIRFDIHKFQATAVNHPDDLNT